MRIAIVDDLKDERNILYERIKKQLDIRHLHAEILKYENGEEFLKEARRNPFSVTFLDIYLNGINGIETAKILRDFDKNGILIFTTTSTDHALDGFRVRALHYLVKPYTDEDISKLIDEIYLRLPTFDKYMNIKCDGCKLQIMFRDIIYAEHFQHKIHIKMMNAKSISSRQTFSDFTNNLKGDSRFFICNRGVIINMEHAVDFRDNSFLMDDGSIMHVSRNLVKSARQTFIDYLFQRKVI